MSNIQVSMSNLQGKSKGLIPLFRELPASKALDAEETFAYFESKSVDKALIRKSRLKGSGNPGLSAPRRIYGGTKSDCTA